jgi:hypothetical protein
LIFRIWESENFHNSFVNIKIRRPSPENSYSTEKLKERKTKRPYFQRETETPRRKKMGKYNLPISMCIRGGVHNRKSD